MAIAIPQPKVADETAVEVRDLVARAREIVIVSEQEVQEAISLQGKLARLEKIIKEDFEPTIKAAHQAHKQALAQRDQHLKPVTEAKKILASKVGAWRAEQERKAREERERMLAEARRREEERRLAAAEAAEAAGDHETAEALLNAAANETAVAPVAPPSPPPKPKGVTFREKWCFEITDPDAIPRKFLVPDEKAIRAYIQAFKRDAKIPGIRIWCEKIAVVK